MIKLMADSTCDLSDEVVMKYNIGIAPLNIIIGDKSYRDKVDLMPEEFYKLLGQLEEHPSTSMPSPDEYLKIIYSAIEEGYKQILCICMSSGTSGSYQSAVIAKNMFYEENQASEVEIYVVDSASMSHGSGWLIMKSAELIQRGCSFEEIIEFNEAYKTNVKHFLCVDDLDNLIKSGRLTNASAFIGKLLKIKPIMSMRKTKGAIVAKERGKKNVIKFYIDEFKSRVNLDITNFIIVGYTTDISLAEDLVNKFKEEVDFQGEIYIMQMGAAVGTHVGAGGLSIYFVERDNLHDGLLKNEMKALMEKKEKIVEKLKS